MKDVRRGSKFRTLFQSIALVWIHFINKTLCAIAWHTPLAVQCCPLLHFKVKS